MVENGMPPPPSTPEKSRRSKRTIAPDSPKIPHVAILVETSLASGRDITRWIASFMREHGPWSAYHEPRSLEDTLPSWLNHWKGDGIIVRVQNKSLANRVKAFGIPAVDVLGVEENSGLPLVHVDDQHIGQLAADHLQQRGFRHFAFCGIKDENWSMRRRDAFVASHAEAGYETTVIEVPRHLTRQRTWESRETILAAWIQELPKPVGVMVCSDQLGPHLLEACRRTGCVIPDEVAVLGVDNDEALCELSNPALSSIHPGHREVGYQAAALLDRIMKGARPPKKPLYTRAMNIVTRRSTDVLAIEDRNLRQALRIIREQAPQGIGVEEVVRHSGLSRSVLQRRFRKQLGKSIHDELLAVRIKHACELMLNTDLTLADIAERSGFTHQEYMGVVLKKNLGKTPAQIRATGEW